MPTIEELLGSNPPKPPLGAQLAEGIRVLSADQTIQFDLYTRYVFALDGMAYWIKGSTANLPFTSTDEVEIGGQSFQLVDGNLNAQFISGGKIYNPLTAADQGLTNTEPLFIDITGPADCFVTGTTRALNPGETYDIPSSPLYGVWLNATSTGHKFSCVLEGTNNSSGAPLSVGIKGSLHYSAITEQTEDSVITVNDIIFTSTSEIDEFNEISPSQLYILEYNDIQFAFSSRSPYYQQADLYHYVGKAIYPTHQLQIIDDATKFNPSLLISNSLPLWLSMNGYVPPYETFSCPIRLYPSYLVDNNLKPPFCSVQVDSTESLVGMPEYSANFSQNQFCRDKVRLISYGASNEQIQTLLAFILQYSIDYGIIGMANMPSVSDEKSKQSEFQILASKKVIEFTINYYQTQARDIVRKLITNAVCYFYVQNDVNLWQGKLLLTV